MISMRILRFDRWVTAVLLLSVWMAGMGKASACSVAWEFPELLPPGYEDRLETHSPAGDGMEPLSTGTLTPVPVTIDPLGAPPDTPWTVFVGTLNVRNEPSTRGGSTTVVGSLSRDSLVTGDYFVVEESDEEWIRFVQGDLVRWISRTGVTRPHPANVAAIAEHGDLPIGPEIVNRWWAVPIDYEPSDLVTIPSIYTNNVSGRIYLLREEARDAVTAMIDAARADGIDFRVASPYRSGERQTSIYLNNVSNNLAQRFSAPPGHSEHQLGTCVDFSRGPTGPFLRTSDAAWQWLDVHGADHGFVQTYTADNIDETGYIEEPWHWRYFGAPEFPVTLSAVPAEGGTVSGGGLVARNSETVIAAAPAPGFAFVGWTGDVESAENPLTLTVTGELTVTAQFMDAFEAGRLAGRREVIEDPSDFGLHTADSIQDLRMGGLLLRADGQEGVRLELILETSSDLVEWQPLESVERQLPLPPDKTFYRVRAAPVETP